MGFNTIVHALGKYLLTGKYDRLETISSKQINYSWANSGMDGLYMRLFSHSFVCVLVATLICYSKTVLLILIQGIVNVVKLTLSEPVESVYVC